jgi:hypothetical protein
MRLETSAVRMELAGATAGEKRVMGVVQLFETRPDINRIIIAARLVCSDKFALVTAE